MFLFCVFFRFFLIDFCCGENQVRDEAREAVLSMDLAAEDAFDLCKKTMKDGWVRLSGDRGALEGEQWELSIGPFWSMTGSK